MKKVIIESFKNQASHFFGVSYHSSIEMCGVKYPPEFHINFWFGRIVFVLGKRKGVK